MADLSPVDLSAAQWAYLLSILRTETKGPSGRLQGITYVAKAGHLWTGEIPGTPRLPAMGVQLKRVEEKQFESHRHFVATTFEIVIGVQSTNASAVASMGSNTPANLEDAMAQLQPFISDGNGNGISSVLRDEQYRLLGSTSGTPNAMRSQITSIDYGSKDGPGNDPQVFAIALVTFTAEALVAI